MKEGYLQMKIGELQEKCKQIEQTLSLEESNLRRIQHRVGEYKDIIKKFKDLNEFEDRLVTKIRKENEQLREKIKCLEEQYAKQPNTR